VTLLNERDCGQQNDVCRTVNRISSISIRNRLSLLNDAGRRPRFLTPGQMQNAAWMFEVVVDYGEHDDPAPTEVASLRAFGDHRVRFWRAPRQPPNLRTTGDATMPTYVMLGRYSLDAEGKISEERSTARGP
jgi:hypothetical protein